MAGVDRRRRYPPVSTPELPHLGRTSRVADLRRRAGQHRPSPVSRRHRCRPTSHQPSPRHWSTCYERLATSPCCRPRADAAGPAGSPQDSSTGHGRCSARPSICSPLQPGLGCHRWYRAVPRRRTTARGSRIDAKRRRPARPGRDGHSRRAAHPHPAVDDTRSPRVRILAQLHCHHYAIPAVCEARAGDVIFADGFSCRTQLPDLAQRKSLHRAQLLAAQLPAL